MERRLTRGRLKELASLSRRKRREESGQTLVEGVRAVAAAVAGGATVRDFVVSHAKRDDGEVHRLAQRAGIVPVYASAQDVARISDVKNSQGVLAVADIRWSSLEDLVELPRVVVLDGIQDPGNVGTIVRTAAWFGIPAILAGSGTADMFSPKVLRATMGGIWDVAVSRSDDLVASLSALREAGHAIIAAELSGTEVGDWVPGGAACVVLGSEAAGVSRDVRRLADQAVCIGGSKKRRGTESLNVAVAAGIIMRHWVRPPKTIV